MLFHNCNNIESDWFGFKLAKFVQMHFYIKELFLLLKED